MNPRQVVRKRIEEHFGWGKTIGRIRQTVYRGMKRVDQHFKLTMTASSLQLAPVQLRALRTVCPPTASCEPASQRMGSDRGDPAVHGVPGKGRGLTAAHRLRLVRLASVPFRQVECCPNRAGRAARERRSMQLTCSAQLSELQKPVRESIDAARQASKRLQPMQSRC